MITSKRFWLWTGLGCLVLISCCESGQVLNGPNMGSPGGNLARNTKLTGQAAIDAAKVKLVDQRINQELDVKNYEAAESDWKELIKMHPEALIYHQGLGNVYYETGEKDKARREYRVAFYDPNARGGYLFETRFGELSYRSGHSADASAAYLAVCTQLLSPSRLAPAASELHSLASRRAEALSLTAQFFDDDSLLYLAYADLACKIDPRAYYPHLVRADAVFRMGRIGDARDERDRAVKLAPPAMKAKIQKSTDDWYSFHNWDHTSGATIQPGGKVVFKRFPQRPPNNRPYTLGPTKKYPSYDELIPYQVPLPLERDDGRTGSGAPALH